MKTFKLDFDALSSIKGSNLTYINLPNIIGKYKLRHGVEISTLDFHITKELNHIIFVETCRGDLGLMLTREEFNIATGNWRYDVGKQLKWIDAKERSPKKTKLYAVKTRNSVGITLCTPFGPTNWSLSIFEVQYWCKLPTPYYMSHPKGPLDFDWTPLESTADMGFNPSISEFYFVTLNDWSVNIAYYDNINQTFVMAPNSPYRHNKVVAWLPMPKLPGDKTGDDQPKKEYESIRNPKCKTGDLARIFGGIGCNNHTVGGIHLMNNDALPKTNEELEP